MNSTLQGKNILVTGGTGLVGAHLIGLLLREKPHKLVTTIRTWDPFSYFFVRGLNTRVILAAADIRDYDRIVDIFTRHEIDVVFHLAAQPIVPSAYAFPRQTIESNVMGTANILEAARVTGRVESVCVAASDKAYGKSDVLPYTENMPLEGLHPYDMSKSATDLLSRGYYETYGLPVVSTRFGNIYGPGDDNFSRVIPGVLRALIQKEEFVIRTDGKMIREYLYVKDVARGYLELAKHMDVVKGEAYNFGSDNIYSTLEMAKKVMTIFGARVPIKILNTAKNEIPEQRLEYSKVQRAVGWKPSTSLQKGIQETIRWYRTYFSLLKKRVNDH